MTNSRMRIGEIGAMISNINNIQQSLNSAAGAALMVELRMRLIGQLSQSVREKLTEIVDSFLKKNPKKKNVLDTYWNCELAFLDDAIGEVFKDKLDEYELKKLDSFRKLRNKLLHADFVGLLEELGIPPTGRQILSPFNNTRNILTSDDIKEAILSVSSDRTRGLATVEKKAKEVINILDKLLYYLAVSG